MTVKTEYFCDRCGIKQEGDNLYKNGITGDSVFLCTNCLDKLKTFMKEPAYNGCEMKDCIKDMCLMCGECNALKENNIYKESLWYKIKRQFRIVKNKK